MLKYNKSMRKKEGTEAEKTGKQQNNTTHAKIKRKNRTHARLRKREESK